MADSVKDQLKERRKRLEELRARLRRSYEEERPVEKYLTDMLFDPVQLAEQAVVQPALGLAGIGTAMVKGPAAAGRFINEANDVINSRRPTPYEDEVRALQAQGSLVTQAAARNAASRQRIPMARQLRENPTSDDYVGTGFNQYQQEADRMAGIFDRLQSAGQGFEDAADLTFGRGADWLQQQGMPAEMVGATVGLGQGALSSMPYSLRVPGALKNAAVRQYYKAFPPFYTPPAELAAPPVHALPMPQGAQLPGLRQLGVQHFDTGGKVRRASRAMERLRAETGPARLQLPEVVKPKGGNWMDYSVVPGGDPSREPITGVRSFDSVLEQYVKEQPATHKGRVPDNHRYRDEQKYPGQSEEARVGAHRDTFLSSPLGRYLRTNFRNYMHNKWGTADDPLADRLIKAYENGEIGYGDYPAAATPEVWEKTVKGLKPGSDPRDLITKSTVSTLLQTPSRHVMRAMLRGRNYDEKRNDQQGPDDLVPNLNSGPYEPHHGLMVYDSKPGDVKHGYYDLVDRHWIRPSPWVEQNTKPGDVLYDFNTEGLRGLFTSRRSQGGNNTPQPSIFDILRNYVAGIEPEEMKVYKELAKSDPDIANFVKQHGRRPSLSYDKLKSMTPDKLFDLALKDKGLQDTMLRRTLVPGGHAVVLRDMPEYQWLDLKTQKALTDEGNAMSHCVGGYCEYVQSGEKKILSLRDKKRMIPHATIELQREAQDRWHQGIVNAGTDPHPAAVPVERYQTIVNQLAEMDPETFNKALVFAARGRRATAAETWNPETARMAALEYPLDDGETIALLRRWHDIKSGREGNREPHPGWERLREFPSRETYFDMLRYEDRMPMGITRLARDYGYRHPLTDQYPENEQQFLLPLFGEQGSEHLQKALEHYVALGASQRPRHSIRQIKWNRNEMVPLQYQQHLHELLADPPAELGELDLHASNIGDMESLGMTRIGDSFYPHLDLAKSIRVTGPGEKSHSLYDIFTGNAPGAPEGLQKYASLQNDQRRFLRALYQNGLTSPGLLDTSGADGRRLYDPGTLEEVNSVLANHMKDYNLLRDDVRVEYDPTAPIIKPVNWLKRAKGGVVKSPLEEEMAPVLSRVEEHYNLPKNILHALITKESRWDPKAVSPKGAKGLVQLMPITQKELGVKDPHDPYESVWAGGRYLAKMLGQFKELPLALAAYNWGPGNMAKHGFDKAPFETKDYVGNVLAMHRSGRYDEDPKMPAAKPEKKPAGRKPPQDPMLALAGEGEDDVTLDDGTMELLAALLQDEELV